MPLVAHSPLKTFRRLREEGQNILTPEQATHQDIRELHIGLLNMMPDSAIEATERQFFRLISASNQIVQFHLHPFTIDGLEHSADATEYLKKNYEPFNKIKDEGLDGLIISGANVTHDRLQEEPFWTPLTEVFDWAKKNVTSIMCSCLATHALIQYDYGIVRKPQTTKRWGVYPHRVRHRQHPLVADINTRFDVPHSRYNEIFQADLERVGLTVLATSQEAGTHLAVSPDGFRVVFFQGHPEYDHISLLKEYKREIIRYMANEIEKYPPFPEHYFNHQASAILNEYRAVVMAGKKQGKTIADFPQSSVLPYLDNTWRDTAKAVFNNWLGKIYHTTHQDRRIPFMAHINPENPLDL